MSSARRLVASLFAIFALSGPPALATAENDGDVATVSADYRVVLRPPPPGYATFSTAEATWTFPEHARELVRSMERRRGNHMRAIEVELGVPVVRRIVVRVARNPDEMRLLAPVGLPPPPYAEGVAYPELGIVLLALTGPNPAVPVDVPNVFVHELSHVALHRAVGRRPIPRWFSEGIAIHQAHERRLERARTLLDAYGDGSLMRMRELDRGFASPDERVVSIAYAQSASLVAFMLSETRGRSKLQRLIRELGVGKPFDVAVDEAYYTPLDALDRAWRKRLAERYSILPYLAGGTTIWVFATIAIALGYARKRREAKARLARMGEEEAALDALDRLLTEKLREAGHEAAEDDAREPWEAASSREPGVPMVSHDGERHTLH